MHSSLEPQQLPKDLVFHHYKWDPLALPGLLDHLVPVEDLDKDLVEQGDQAVHLDQVHWGGLKGPADLGDLVGLVDQVDQQALEVLAD